MATLHMTEAEVARDLHAVLEEVQRGAEVVIQEGYRPIAVLRPPQPAGRSIDEIVRDAEDRNLEVTLDDEFGNDLEQIIATHRQQTWTPSSD